MSTASRTVEAERAAAAYHAALVKIGAEVVAEALRLWHVEVPPSGGISHSVRWLRQVLALVKRGRKQSRQLARAYYRLDRALNTGHTVTYSRGEAPSTSLNDLRSEFRELAGDGPAPNEDNATIPVETIDGLDADAKRRDREAEQEMQTAIGNLGPVNLEKKLREIDTSKPADEVDEDRQTAHDEAGARGAAAAERMVLNGARDEVFDSIKRDPRALGWIRVSTTGTPCGFCAMLISRGPVYGSAQSATNAIYGDGDLYHDNCYCIALPVWSKGDWEKNPRYALNREYHALWPKVTKNLSGKDALSAWRRYIKTEQRAQAARTKSPGGE